MAQANEDGQTQIGSLVMEYATLWQDSDPEHTFYKSSYHVIAFSTDDGKLISPPTIFFVPKNCTLPEFLHGGAVSVRGVYGPDHTLVTQLETWLREHAVHVIEVDRAIIATN
jgi:hypothetical protein